LSTELEQIGQERDRTAAMEQAKRDFLPAIKHLVDVYWEIDDARLKNSMLRNVLDHIDYLKTERNKKGAGSTANFTLQFFPRLPENR
ncbi:MAG: hypothetical protein QM683_15945, partial [Lacrimispora sp.]